MGFKVQLVAAVNVHFLHLINLLHSNVLENLYKKMFYLTCPFQTNNSFFIIITHSKYTLRKLPMYLYSMQNSQSWGTYGACDTVQSLIRWFFIPWSFLVEGDEGCIGPRGTVVFMRNQKKMQSHAWHHSIHAWLLGQSSCSSPCT